MSNTLFLIPELTFRFRTIAQKRKKWTIEPGKTTEKMRGIADRTISVIVILVILWTIFSKRIFPILRSMGNHTLLISYDKLDRFFLFFHPAIANSCGVTFAKAPSDLVYRGVRFAYLCDSPMGDLHNESWSERAVNSS